MSELSDLIELYQRDPQQIHKLFKENPGLAKRFMEMQEIYLAGEEASVDSFRRIYLEFFGRPLPYVAEQVVEEFLWALENKKGVILEAWRGFGKSTFFTAWGPARLSRRSLRLLWLVPSVSLSPW